MGPALAGTTPISRAPGGSDRRTGSSTISAVFRPLDGAEADPCDTTQTSSTSKRHASYQWNIPLGGVNDGDACWTRLALIKIDLIGLEVLSLDFPELGLVMERSS